MSKKKGGKKEEVPKVDKFTKERIDLSNISSITVQLQKYNKPSATISTTLEVYDTNGVVRWLFNVTISPGKYFGEIEIWETKGYVSKTEDFIVECKAEIPR